MTVKELKEELAKYDDDGIVFADYNQEIFRVTRFELGVNKQCPEKLIQNAKLQRSSIVLSIFPF